MARRVFEIEGREVQFRGDFTWHVIEHVFTTLPPKTRTPDYLIAAKHLLALGNYDDPDVVFAEIAMTMKELRKAAPVAEGADYRSRLVLRKAYAVKAGGLARQIERTTLNPGKRPHVPALIDAVRRKLLDFIPSDDFTNLWKASAAKFTDPFDARSPDEVVSAKEGIKPSVAHSSDAETGATDDLSPIPRETVAVVSETGAVEPIESGRAESNEFKPVSSQSGAPRWRANRRRPRAIIGAVAIMVIAAVAVPLAIRAASQPQVDQTLTSGQPGAIAQPPSADVAGHQITSSSWGPPRDAVSAQSRNSIVTLNSMIDNPVHGDERNFAQVRPAMADNAAYVDEISIVAGEELVGYVYFSNDAAPEATESVAENTRLRLQMPAVVYGSANVQVLLSADNATPAEIWDGFTVVLPDPTQQAALRYVPDSATIHVGGAADGQPLDVGGLFGSEGALLGCDTLDGRLPPSDHCSGYVTFRFIVDQPNFTIDAAARLKGSGEPYANHVDVSPGDVVEVRLVYTNTGTTQQNDVSLRVGGLPEEFRYAAESTKVANSKTNGEYRSTVDGVTTVGYNVGSYAPGGNAYLKFDAIVEEKASSSASGSRWIVASPFARATTANGSKEADLNFTLFGNAEPTAEQSSAQSTDYWQANWGPQREMFTMDTGGAPYPTFNSISDNPDIGDERNFVGLRWETNADVPNVWQDQVWARIGQTYVMRVYVSNSGADSNGIVSAGWLQGSKVRIGLSRGDNEVSVFGVLSATNATTVWDGATLHFDESADVAFDTDYALLENNAYLEGGFQLGGAVFSADGAQLGYTTMDGVVRPGYEYAGYVTVRLHVVERPTQ